MNNSKISDNPCIPLSSTEHNQASRDDQNEQFHERDAAHFARLRSPLHHLFAGPRSGLDASQRRQRAKEYPRLSLVYARTTH